MAVFTFVSEAAYRATTKCARRSCAGFRPHLPSRFLVANAPPWGGGGSGGCQSRSA